VLESNIAGPARPIPESTSRRFELRDFARTAHGSLGWLAIATLVAVVIVQALLLGRLWLQLTSQDVESGLRGTLFSITNELVQPFTGLEPSEPIKSTGILEFATLVAIEVYLVIAASILILAFILRSALSLIQRGEGKDRPLVVAMINLAEKAGIGDESAQDQVESAPGQVDGSDGQRQPETSPSTVRPLRLPPLQPRLGRLVNRRASFFAPGGRGGPVTSKRRTHS
jgi:hypothetical protein